MAQRLIPGVGYVNETGTGQRLIPGVGYVDESQSTGGAGNAPGATLTGTATIAGGAATGGGAGLAPGATLTGTATITGGAATGGSGLGTFTTLPMKNNTGTLLASETGITINFYNTSTGALVVQKTGITTNASGIATVTDVALVAGTTYAYEPVLTGGRRRLPLKAAT